MPATQTQLGTASGALPAPFISDEVLKHHDLPRQGGRIKGARSESKQDFTLGHQKTQLTALN